MLNEELKRLNEWVKEGGVYPLNVFVCATAEKRPVGGNVEKAAAVMDEIFVKMQADVKEEDCEELDELYKDYVAVAQYVFKEEKTIDEAAAKFDVSEDVIKERINKFLRKVRNPKYLRVLKDSL